MYDPEPSKSRSNMDSRHKSTELDQKNYATRALHELALALKINSRKLMLQSEWTTLWLWKRLRETLTELNMRKGLVFAEMHEKISHDYFPVFPKSAAPNQMCAWKLISNTLH